MCEFRGFLITINCLTCLMRKIKLNLKYNFYRLVYRACVLFFINIYNVYNYKLEKLYTLDDKWVIYTANLYLTQIFT